MGDAREKAAAIIGPSTVRDLEEAGIAVAGRCVSCRHWALPSWDASGFGACHLPSYRAEQKKPLPPVLKTTPSGGSVATHETFGCVFWEARS